MASTELVLATEATSLLHSILKAARSIFEDGAQQRAISRAKLENLRIQIQTARASEVSKATHLLWVQNFHHTLEIWNLVESRAGQPGFAESYESAKLAHELLDENLQDLVRRLRK